jgi:hypothetical protein
MLSDSIRLVAFGVMGLGILGAYSCSNPQPALPPYTMATSVASPKASAAPLTRDQAVVKTFSVANMRQDVLDDCIDFTIRVESPSATGLDWATKDAPDLHTHLAKLGTELRKPCSEQFADRLVLATCVAITKREGQELQLIERYYNPDTVGLDDIYLQECLRLGGIWEAVAKDSPEFRKARAKATLRGLTALASGSG